MKKRYFNPKAEEFKLTLNDVLTATSESGGSGDLGMGGGEGSGGVTLPEVGFPDA